MMVFWRVVFAQTMTHTPVVVSVAEFWTSVEISEFFEAFFMFCITCSATVEQVQAHELTLVPRLPLEHNGRTQYTVNWTLFKFHEIFGILLKKEESRLAMSSDTTTIFILHNSS